ncbi:hypothetical protein RB195_010908 [Necator americanus]
MRRYPVFNSDRSQHNANATATQLESSERCCVAVKFRCGWVRCSRKRSRRALNTDLERVALSKKLNVAVSSEDPHMGICSYHWRLIKNGEQDVALNSEELKFWEASETKADKYPRYGDMSDVMIVGSSTSSDHEDSDDGTTTDDGKRNILQQSELNWREVDMKQKKVRCASDVADESEHHRDSEEEERSGLSTLSAASLRRYRKFFMIPTKASASKHAMLEGVANHFERLPVRTSDTVVHFIYTARNRINTIE